MAKTKRQERIEGNEPPATDLDNVPQPAEEPTALPGDLPETEEVKEETKPGAENPPIEFETVTNGASFKEFEEGEVFTCVYSGEKSIRQKPGKKPDQIVGSIMGYIVTEMGTGRDYILGNTKSIQERFSEAKKGDIFRLTFQGKVALDGGHTFNSFKIEKAKPKQ